MSNQNVLLAQIAKAASAAPPPGFGMTGAAMVNLLGGNLSAKFLSEVVKQANASEELSDTSLKDSKGLVSKDDLKNIFTYVDAALALPTDIPAAEQYLGYKKDDIFFKEESHKFLSPENQVQFDLPIVAHAKKWAGLEQDIKNIGNSLDSYAKRFVTQANEVLDVLGDLNKYMEVHSFLDKDGKEIVDCGMELLGNWKRDTQEHQTTAKNLYKNLQSFDDELENTIKKSVDNRISQISNMKLSEEIKKVTEEINSKKEEIKRLQKQYNEYVGLAFTGAVGMILPYLGIISWSITGGIYGKKAEDVRKNKNKAETDLAQLQKKLNADQKVIAGAHKLETVMIDFQMALKAAIIGVQHINTAWASIVSDIENALEDLNKISDPQYVTRVKSLITQIKLAKDAWNTCGSVTKELIDTFDAARAEHNRKTGR